MTNTEASLQTLGSDTDHGAAQGWYFYGITARRGTLASVLAAANGVPNADDGAATATRDAAPLQVLEFSALAAVVRPVSLADFSLTAVQQRAQDASVLEAMVRSHNRVVEAIHAQQAILPAKFGMVYAHAEDVVAALKRGHDERLEQLIRLEGCDEWAVHLYADRAVVRKQVATEDPAVRRLREQRDAARPGRAYFFEQQYRDELDAATEQALLALAQASFERLTSCAVSGQGNAVGSTTHHVGEVEILRGSFLVARYGVEQFAEEVRSSDKSSEGLRCECSGPWPPYSFAGQDDEVVG